MVEARYFSYNTKYKWKFIYLASLIVIIAIITESIVEPLDSYDITLINSRPSKLVDNFF